MHGVILSFSPRPSGINYAWGSTRQTPTSKVRAYRPTCRAYSISGKIRLCLKNVTILSCYNFDLHEPILIIFTRTVCHGYHPGLESLTSGCLMTENNLLCGCVSSCCPTASWTCDLLIASHTPYPVRHCHTFTWTWNLMLRIFITLALSVDRQEGYPNVAAESRPLKCT